jgi:hypothetical protein
MTAMGGYNPTEAAAWAVAGWIPMASSKPQHECPIHSEQLETAHCMWPDTGGKKRTGSRYRER